VLNNSSPVTAVKFSFVCALFFVCVSYSLAEDSSPWSGESVDVQHLLKFSSTLSDSHRTGFVSAVNVRFAMYDEPNGGQAYWQETQNVGPDSSGHYTVLLGETTLGGLPPDIFTSRGKHWLGVRASGEPEQPRILLVELPSAWKPDPINWNIHTSAPIGKRAILPSGPTERRLTLILLIMFIAGTAMSYWEVVRWWKARMEQYEPPPLANLISYIPGPKRRWRATQVLWFPLGRLRAIRGRLQPSVRRIDDDDDRPEKAA